MTEEQKADVTPIPVEKPEHPSIPLWVSAIGWYGVLAIFGAYYLSSLGKIDQEGLYQTLNATGAIGLAILCFKKHAWQPLALNLAWLAIALYALWVGFV